MVDQPNSDDRRMRENLIHFRKAELRIKASAIVMGTNAKRGLASRGYSNGELDYGPLISKAWELLADDKSVHLRTSDEAFYYFRRQIWGRVGNLRKSAEARTRTLVIVSDSTENSATNTIHCDDDCLSVGAIAEEAKAVRDFGAYLVEQDPKFSEHLLRLLQIALNGTLKRADQAEELGLPVKFVSRMGDRLKAHYVSYTGIQLQLNQRKIGPRR